MKWKFVLYCAASNGAIIITCDSSKQYSLEIVFSMSIITFTMLVAVFF